MQDAFESLGYEPMSSKQLMLGPTEIRQPYMKPINTVSLNSFFGWGDKGKYYHKLKKHKRMNGEVVYLDCNSWERMPKFNRPDVDQGYLPCPKCFRKNIAVGDLLRSS